MEIKNISHIKTTTGLRKNSRLYPGGSSQEGFLLPGQDYDFIIARDKKAMESMGVDLEYILLLLNHLFSEVEVARIKQRSRREIKYKVPNEKKYYLDISPSLFRGWQECPLCLDNDAYDSFILKDGRSLRGGRNQLHFANGVSISDLLPHLIQEHGFFQGGIYRTSPEDIVETLGQENIPGGIDAARNLPLVGQV